MHNCSLNMLKVLIPFIFILLISKSMHAQIFKAVIPLGFNFTQIDGDDLAGYNKTGFNGGVGAMISLNEADSWEMGMEILYSQLGSNTNSRSPNQIKTSLDYAAIPLYVNYKDVGNGYIGLGVTINRLVDQRRYEDNIEVNPPRNLKSMDYDIMGQIGYLFNPNFRLTLRASYSILQFGINERLQHNYITLRCDTILNGLLSRRKKSGFSR